MAEVDPIKDAEVTLRGAKDDAERLWDAYMVAKGHLTLAEAHLRQLKGERDRARRGR